MPTTSRLMISQKSLRAWIGSHIKYNLPNKKLDPALKYFKFFKTISSSKKLRAKKVSVLTSVFYSRIVQIQTAKSSRTFKQSWAGKRFYDVAIDISSLTHATYESRNHVFRLIHMKRRFFCAIFTLAFGERKF